MATTLDPITVVGTNFGYPGLDYVGWQSNTYDLDSRLLADIYEAAKVYCDSSAYVDDCIRILNQNVNQIQAVRGMVNNFAHADNLISFKKAVGEAITTLEAIQVNGYDEDVASDFPFSGTTVMPFSALRHFWNASGRTRSIPIETAVPSITMEQIPHLYGYLKHADAIRGQVVPINGQFSYDTRNGLPGAHYTLGNISLFVEGNLIIDATGPYEFRGVIRAYNDVYNGGKWTADRSTIGNMWTSFLSALEIAGAQPYEIEIPGQIELHFRGMKPD